jgi:protein SCO1
MNSLRPSLLPLPFLLTVALLLTSCAPRSSSTSRPPAPPTHDLRGEVVGINLTRRTLLVHHEEIPGYMPAMTMEFTTPGVDPATFHEGQRITATLAEGEPGEFQLTGLRVLDAVQDQVVASAAGALRQDTLIRGKSAYREVGEAVPAFTLYNQDGVAVSFDHFRGKRVVLNFIFTRCPVPTMCPLSTAKMMQLQAAAKQAGVRDFELVSISFDAAYDTPPVLKAYAAGRGIDTSNFSFLTGPEPAIRDLLVQFGVIVEPGENVFKHTLATLLIGRDGKILYRADGSAWEPEDFLKRL